MDLRNAWRVSWVLVVVVAAAAFGWFVLNTAGSVIYLLVLSWFASLALEPSVCALARRMPRAMATGLVMAAVAVFVVLFLLAFGRLFLQQLAQLVQSLPDVIQGSLNWVNRRLRTSYRVSDVVRSLNLTPEKVSGYVNDVLGGLLGLLGSIAETLLKGLSFVLLTFYLSADGPRLRRWLASRLPLRQQELFVTAWELTTLKTGGYVAARAMLATVNAATSAVVFALVGLPSWLALALWTGLVAQFVPTIGTYISIVLPVLVGLVSPTPWTGLAVLTWGILYQQVENLFLEPRLSARAVDVHPAVAFVAVLLGTSLFGVAGALLAVPVSAMLLALFELRVRSHELLEDLDPAGPAPPGASSTVLAPDVAPDVAPDLAPDLAPDVAPDLAPDLAHPVPRRRHRPDAADVAMTDVTAGALVSAHSRRDQNMMASSPDPTTPSPGTVEQARQPGSDLMLRLPGWIALGYGILTALLGVAVLLWPGPTLFVAVLFLATQLVVTGVLNAGLALSTPGTGGGERTLLVIVAALSFLIALLILRRPLQTLLVVTLLIGATWVVRGVVDMVTAIPGGRSHRGWSFAFGLVSLVAGVVVLVNPGISLVTFVWISGIWMIAFGIVVVVSYVLRSRSW